MNYKKGTQTRGCMKSVMRYVSQLSKTLWDGQQLVSGIGCQPETAFDEFLSTKLLHHKDGGYVIVSLMKKKFVDELHWIEEKEMLDLVAIAQSSPGAIAINGAIVVGYKLAGIAGVLVSIIGTVIPPFVIIALLSVCYNAFRTNELVSQMLEGMQAGVGAVIASVTYEMGAGIVKEKDGISLLIMAGAFVASCVFEVNVVYIVIICGLLGVLRTCMSRKGAGK